MSKDIVMTRLTAAADTGGLPAGFGRAQLTVQLILRNQLAAATHCRAQKASERELSRARGGAERQRQRPLALSPAPLIATLVFVCNKL